MKKSYKIEVDCPNCANKMERAAAATEGVVSANISFMTLRMTVEFAEGTDEKTVMAQVVKNCKKAVSDGEIIL